jgi:hypothetical protein
MARIQTIAFACCLAGTLAAAEHPCADIAVPEQRLACYDRAFTPTGTNPQPIERVDEKSREQKFGLSRAQLRSVSPEDAELAPDRITATIVRIDDLKRGRRLLTLDNAQRWILTESGAKGTLAAGDQITIKSAALGSFLLMTPSGLALRAKRQL